MNIKKYTSETFDQIKHVSDEGNEFWYARELASVLDYKRWDKFKNVIEKAKESCNNSGLKIEDHFSHVGNMVDLGSGAQREIENIMLDLHEWLDADGKIGQQLTDFTDIIQAPEVVFTFKLSRRCLFSMKEEYFIPTKTFFD